MPSSTPANTRLRDTRHATTVTPAATRVMSRADLARAVNTWIHHTTGRQVTLDPTYLGRLERGVIRWPHPLIRQALRATLGATTDADLGFTQPGPR